MKKLSLIAALLLVSTQTYAADRTEAFNKVCKALYSESSKQTCLKVVKTYSFYQDGALAICSALYNDTGKVNCLTEIGDKDYESFEIEQCGSLYNDSSKITCFKENGLLRSALPNCLKKEELINLLSMSRDNLNAGNFSAVDATISNLITTLTNCQK